jgi:hypothetical protein
LAWRRKSWEEVLWKAAMIDSFCCYDYDRTLIEHFLAMTMFSLSLAPNPVTKTVCLTPLPLGWILVQVQHSNSLSRAKTTLSKRSHVCRTHVVQSPWCR